MGSVQNKRASGRQAPPDVYACFFSATDADSEEYMVETAKEIAWNTLAAIIVGFVLLYLSACGFNPFDDIEDTDSW